MNANVILTVETQTPNSPKRPYSYEAGDERFFDFEEAVEQARLRSISNGVRQTVRGSTAPGTEGTILWLVQDI